MRHGARTRARAAREASAARKVLSVAALLAALVVTAGLLLVASSGCDMPGTGGLGRLTGSGTPATKTYDFTGFTKVEADYGFKVEVVRGDAYAVLVTVDDNLVSELRVKAEGDTLRINMNDRYSAYDHATLTAKVTMPGLQGLDASGAASIDARGFASGDPLALKASGAAVLTLTDVTASDVQVDCSGGAHVQGALAAQDVAGEASGAGVLERQGSARKLQLEASGGAQLRLAGLKAQSADLTLSGGASGSVDVTGSLDVQASGGAHLEYSGAPQLGKIDVSGGAEVKPAGQ